MNHSRLFKIVAVGEQADAIDVILVAQDGEVWRASKSRQRGLVQIGDLLDVPLIEGRADFLSMGLCNVQLVGHARPEVIASFWSFHRIVPVEDEERRTLRALIDVPSPLTIEELVKILM